MFHRVCHQLVKNQSQCQSPRRFEGYRASVQADSRSLGLTWHNGGDLIFEDIAQADIVPLHMRNQIIRSAKRLNAPNETLTELGGRWRRCQRSVRDTTKYIDN